MNKIAICTLWAIVCLALTKEITGYGLAAPSSGAYGSSGPSYVISPAISVAPASTGYAPAAAVPYAPSSASYSPAISVGPASVYHSPASAAPYAPAVASYTHAPVAAHYARAASPYAPVTSPYAPAGHAYGPAPVKYSAQKTVSSQLYPGQQNYKVYQAPPQFSVVALPIIPSAPVAKLYVPSGKSSNYKQPPAVLSSY